MNNATIKENRQQIWDEYSFTKNSSMRRMFLDYNRYYEASCIYNTLNKLIYAGLDNTPNFRVLDFGCGVADYGIYLARHGADVTLHDIDTEAILFAQYRFEREKLKVDINPQSMLKEFDLVIFGEVLDHLVDPLGLISQYVNKKTTFIWTSSYPFRSDDPNDVHWQHDHHPESARLQQPAIRKLLHDNYHQHNFGGQRNLWTFNITT